MATQYVSNIGVSKYEIGNMLERISEYDKKKGDWQWLKDWGEFYANSYPDNHERDMENALLNFRLFNTRGLKSPHVVSSINSIDLQEEGIMMAGEDFSHFDILSPIMKSLWGQQQLMSLNPMVTDSSLSNINMRKKKRLSMQQDWITSNIINPIQEQAQMEWAMENEIEDFQELTPEEQAEAERQIQERVSQMTYADIDKYMSSEYKSPSEMQLNQILDFVMKRDKLKFWTDENFKNMLLAGRQIYESIIIRNKARARVLNPVKFRCGGQAETMFIEEMDWAVYEESISISTLFNEYGHELEKKHLRALSELHFNGNNTNRLKHGEFPEPMNTRVAQYDAKTGFFDHAPHIKTREGQEFLKDLYNKFGGSVTELNSIVRNRIAFKYIRKRLLVDRYDPTTDSFNQFWTSEHYQKNKRYDVRVRECWVPCVYGLDKIDQHNDLYFRMGPIPYQFKSKNDPFDVELPFTGVYYSKLMGNTDYIAPIDPGKPWQDKFNIHIQKVTEKQQLDIGKVFAVATSLKPEGWSFGKWLSVIKYSKMVPLDTSNEEMNGIDAQMIKALDLEQVANLAADLQYLDWIKHQAMLALNYNPSRLGQIVPQTPVTNNQQNIQQSTYQTQDLFTIHNEAVERFLHRHMTNEKAALKNNSYVATYVLDDMSIAELEVNTDLLDESEMGIVVRNSAEDFNMLNKIKNEYTHAMIQTGIVGFGDIIKLNLTRNLAGALNLSEDIDRKTQKQQQQRFAEQQELVAMQEKAKREIIELQHQFEAVQNELDRINKLSVVAVDSMKFKHQMDVDGNQVADSLEREREIAARDAEEAVKDRKHEKEMLDKELANKLEVARLNVKNRAKAAQNKSK